jgi:hypothetical protein
VSRERSSVFRLGAQSFHAVNKETPATVVNTSNSFHVMPMDCDAIAAVRGGKVHLQPSE